ncbi:hypothetical protein THAOC_16391, partial [Thalassiosira oceanica]
MRTVKLTVVAELEIAAPPPPRTPAGPAQQLISESVVQCGCRYVVTPAHARIVGPRPRPQSTAATHQCHQSTPLYQVVKSGLFSEWLARTQLPMIRTKYVVQRRTFWPRSLALLAGADTNRCHGIASTLPLQGLPPSQAEPEPTVFAPQMSVSQQRTKDIRRDIINANRGNPRIVMGRAPSHEIGHRKGTARFISVKRVGGNGEQVKSVSISRSVGRLLRGLWGPHPQKANGHHAKQRGPAKTRFPYTLALKHLPAFHIPRASGKTTWEPMSTSTPTAAPSFHAEILGFQPPGTPQIKRVYVAMNTLLAYTLAL